MRNPSKTKNGPGRFFPFAPTQVPRTVRPAESTAKPHLNVGRNPRREWKAGEPVHIVKPGPPRAAASRTLGARIVSAEYRPDHEQRVADGREHDQELRDDCDPSRRGRFARALVLAGSATFTLPRRKRAPVVIGSRWTPHYVEHIDRAAGTYVCVNPCFSDVINKSTQDALLLPVTERQQRRIDAIRNVRP